MKSSENSEGENNALMGESPPSVAEPSQSETSVAEYVTPPVFNDESKLTWDEDAPIASNYKTLGSALAHTGGLYRNTAHGEGLIQPPVVASAPVKYIMTGAALAAVIVDRLKVKVVRDGKQIGNRIPQNHLQTMLGTEAFLQQFAPVDTVTLSPKFQNDFTLTKPGYNHGGVGQRVFYVGASKKSVPAANQTRRFLDAMNFASPADWTNALAFALTRMLRNHFPGGKPIVLVTASKSHAGKDTIVYFATGATKAISISYQATDWALERAFVGVVKTNPDVAVVNIENARLDRRSGFIRSGFVERIITDPNPVLYSTGSGAPVRRPNDFVLAITTNEGTLSTDLMNRGLHIRLEPTGNIEDRVSEIGNPKEEFLPAHREEIEDELRGMIERWKDAGRPLDTAVKHPFTAWAQTVGGILMVNGFKDFLGNYGMRKAVDDPIRRALGLLGAAKPDDWLRPRDWAQIAEKIGVAKAIIADIDRDTEESRARGIGSILTAHKDETFEGETEDKRLSVRLEKARRRFDGSEPTTRYKFSILKSEEIPADEPTTPGNVISQ